MKGDEVLARDVVVDPDQAAALGADASRERVDLGGDLGSIGAAGGDDELVLRVELQGGREQERQALLTGDPAVEKGVRARAVDAIFRERLSRLAAAVDVGVDSVVDDMHAAGLHGRICLQDVLALGFRGHCEVD